MQCENCGSYVDEGWSFCPNCGRRITVRRNDEYDFLSIFTDMQKEIDKMNDIFEKNFEVFDMRPFFNQKPVKGKGFSIKITTKNGGRPEVSVKTFGDFDLETVQKNVSKYIGWEPKPQEKQARAEHKEPPKVTEEPDANFRRMGDSIVIEVKLPGVKSIEDIKVQDLESSVEVRARAGDKGYFKILTKPENYKLVNKQFSGENLFLEFK